MVGIQHALKDVVVDGDVALFDLGPVDGGILFGSADLLQQLVVILHEVAQSSLELAVVLPHAQIVEQDGSVQLGHHDAVAFFVHVGNLHEAAHVIIGRHAGGGVTANNAHGAFHLGHVQGAVAADGAAGAAGHLHGVLLSDCAVVVHSLLAAEANAGGLARSGLTGVDGAAFSSTPGQAGTANPTGGSGRILGEGLGNLGHNVVVVGADQVGHNIVVQLLDSLSIGNLDALGAVESDGLQLLGAEDLAQTAAAAVAVAGDDAGQVQQVFTGAADGNNVDAGHGRLGDRSGSLMSGGLAPQLGSITDFDLIVVHVDVNGLVGSAFDDDGVVAAGLHHGSSVAAHVSIDDGVVLGEGRQGGNGAAARAGSAGAGVGASRENDLVFGSLGGSAGGHFFIHDAVRDTLTADILEILFAALDGAGASGQVDTKQITHPTVHYGIPPIDFLNQLLTRLTERQQCPPTGPSSERWWGSRQRRRRSSRTWWTCGSQHRCGASSRGRH